MKNQEFIKNKIKQNSQILDIFSTTDLIDAWTKTTGKDIAQHLGETARTGSNYASALLDAKIALNLIKDLGKDGKVAFKDC